MNRQTATLYLILSIIFALILTKIYVQADLAATDEEYALLQQQIKEIQVTNIVLKEQVLQAKSLTTIAQEARARGFTDANYLLLK